MSRIRQTAAAVLILGAAGGAPLVAQVTGSPNVQPSPKAALTPQQRSQAASALQRAATWVVAGSSTFRYLPGNRWVEIVDGKEVRSYHERWRGSSDSAVSMIEDSTRNSVSISFYFNEVSYNGGKLEVPITSVSSTVDHTNVTTVRYPGGSLRLDPRSTTKWTERNAAGTVIFKFVETGRGAGGVSLVDDSRDIQLNILPSINAIHIATAANPKPRLLYPITGMSSVQFFSVAVID